jgi:hypothetical protein
MEAQAIAEKLVCARRANQYAGRVRYPDEDGFQKRLPQIFMHRNRLMMRA